MATAFQGLGAASVIDPSFQKRYVVDRDNTQKQSVEESTPLEILTITSVTGATTLTSDIVGECLVFSGGASGLSYQLPTAYNVLVKIQNKWGGQIATSYGDNTLVTTRVENRTAGDVTLTTNTGLTMSSIIIPTGIVAYIEWLVRNSSPTSPSVEVRVRSSSNSNTGVLSITNQLPQPYAYLDLTDVRNPILANVEWNSRSALDPAYLGADDSETIQNTVDAVNALGGGTVVIPQKSGGWTITTPINLNGLFNLTIKGENGCTFNYSTDITLINANNTIQSTIQGISFAPANGFFPSSPAISITGGAGANIIIKENSFTKSGIVISGSFYKIQDNTFLMSERNAISLQNQSLNSRVTNNQFINWGAFQANRQGFSPATSMDLSLLSTWGVSTAYTPGDVVDTGVGLYWCRSITGGGVSGLIAPTGKSFAVVDNEVTWIYVGSSTIYAVYGESAGPTGSLSINGYTVNANYLNGLYRGIALSGYNISIFQNTFGSCFMCCTTPFPLGSASSTAGNIFNYQYVNNNHQNISKGFFLTASNGLGAGAWVNFKIDGNTFINIVDSALLVASAVSVDLTGGDGDVVISNLSICGNLIYNVTGVANTIEVLMANNSNVTSMVICQNTFDGSDATDTAILITDGAALGTQRIVANDNQTNLGEAVAFPTGSIAAAANQVIYDANAIA
jgi:hypothetical protein